MSEEGGEPREDRGRERPSRPGARYSTFVGIAFLALVAIAALNGLSTDEGSVLGVEAVEGRPLAEFAVPAIPGPLDGDANIAQDDCETAVNPCPEDDRRTPACEVDLEGAIRVCDLFDRPLVISFWFTRGAECLGAQDVFDEVARSYRGRVNFLSLNVRDDREKVESTIAERGWTVPVGWDRDGAVSNIYRVAVCPTVAFAYPGGIFQSAAVEDPEVTVAQLSERVDELVRESRKRAP
jgi:hypothetical protein